jgi:spermidine synthase
MAAVFKGCLDDPRVRVVEGDVGGVIMDSSAQWDAILLDVDNGPEGLSREANDALYDARGLARAHSALAKGGVLSVWSQGPDPRFSKRLKAAGFSVEEAKVRANAGRSGARHFIWLASR